MFIVHLVHWKTYRPTGNLFYSFIFPSFSKNMSVSVTTCFLVASLPTLRVAHIRCTHFTIRIYLNWLCDLPYRFASSAICCSETRLMLQPRPQNATINIVNSHFFSCCSSGELVCLCMQWVRGSEVAWGVEMTVHLCLVLS